MLSCAPALSRLSRCLRLSASRFDSRSSLSPASLSRLSLSGLRQSSAGLQPQQAGTNDLAMDMRMVHTAATYLNERHCEPCQALLCCATSRKCSNTNHTIKRSVKSAGPF